MHVDCKFIWDKLNSYPSCMQFINLCPDWPPWSANKATPLNLWWKAETHIKIKNPKTRLRPAYRCGYLHRICWLTRTFSMLHQLGRNRWSCWAELARNAGPKWSWTEPTKKILTVKLLDRGGYEDEWGSMRWKSRKEDKGVGKEEKERRRNWGYQSPMAAREWFIACRVCVCVGYG